MLVSWMCLLKEILSISVFIWKLNKPLFPNLHIPLIILQSDLIDLRLDYQYSEYCSK